MVSHAKKETQLSSFSSLAYSFSQLASLQEWKDEAGMKMLLFVSIPGWMQERRKEFFFASNEWRGSLKEKKTKTCFLVRMKKDGAIQNEQCFSVTVFPCLVASF